jgi:hypothetical protein
MAEIDLHATERLINRLLVAILVFGLTYIMFSLWWIAWSIWALMS